MKKRFTIVAVMIVMCSVSQAFSESDTISAVKEVLLRQVDAWNRHDLEGFMAGYWNSPELTFFSGTDQTSGWQPTLERYRKRYQGEGREGNGI